MPATPIQFTNAKGGKSEVVRNKNKGLVTFFVLVFYNPEVFGIILDALFAGEFNHLIEDKSRSPINLV